MYAWPLPSSILACCLLVIRDDSRIDRAITQVIHPPPRSITWLVTVVYQAGSLGVVVVLAGLALLARLMEIARDIGLSAAGTAAACGILIAPDRKPRRDGRRGSSSTATT